MSFVTAKLKNNKTIATIIASLAVVFAFGDLALAANLSQTTGSVYYDGQVGDPSYAAIGFAVHTSTTQRLTEITLQIRRDPASISSATDALNVSVYEFSNTSSAPAYPLTNTDPSFVGESTGIDWSNTPSSYAARTWTFSTPIILDSTKYYQIWVHRTGTHTSSNFWDLKIFTSNTTDDHLITRRFGVYELTGSVYPGQMAYVTSTLSLADDAFYDNSIYGPPTHYYNFGHAVDADGVPGSYASLGVRFTPTITYSTKHISFRMDRQTHSFDFGNIYAKVYTYDGTSGRGTQIATSSPIATAAIPQCFGDCLANLAKISFPFTDTLTFEAGTSYNIVIEPTNYAVVSSSNPVFPALNLGVRHYGAAETPMLHNDPLDNPSLTSHYSTSTRWLFADYPYLSALFATANEFASNVPGGASAVNFYSTPSPICQFRQWKLNITFGSDSDLFPCQKSNTCSVGVAWNSSAANTSTYTYNNNDGALSGDLTGLSAFPYYMPIRSNFVTGTTFNARAYLCDTANSNTCRLDFKSPTNTHILAYSDNYQFQVKDFSDPTCSSTIYESPGELEASSTTINQNTAFNDMYNKAIAQCDTFGENTPIIGGVVQGLCRVFMTLFVPSSEAFNTLLSLRGAVTNKPPFAYFTVFSNSMSSLGSATSTASVISSESDFVANVQAYTSGYDWYETVMTLVRALLWLGFGFGILKFFKYFSPNS